MRIAMIVLLLCFAFSAEAQTQDSLKKEWEGIHAKHQSRNMLFTDTIVFGDSAQKVWRYIIVGDTFYVKGGDFSPVFIRGAVKTWERYLQYCYADSTPAFRWVYDEAESQKRNQDIYERILDHYEYLHEYALPDFMTWLARQE